MDPRWGGSFDDFERTIEKIRPCVRENPALGGSLARAVGWRPASQARNGHWEEAMPGLEAAALLAPDPLFIGYVGLAAKRQGDLRRALGYLSQALRLAPMSPRILYARAGVRNALGNPAGAALDAERAIALEDDVGVYYSIYGQALIKLGRVEDARAAYHTAMQFPDQRHWAFRHWCQTYIVPAIMEDEAMACTGGLINEYPEKAEVLFMRAWVLHKSADPSANEVAQKFFAVADTTNELQREMIEQLKAEMGER